MLSYRLASDEEIDKFMAGLKEEEGEYLEKTLAQMDSNWEEFSQMAKTIGSVWQVDREGVGVGFYWIEERGKVVHLHGILIKPEEQGKGIGTEILQRLEDEYLGKMEAIELGVHQSNQRAKQLYERLGFREIRYQADLGYYILQLSLSNVKPMESIKKE
jgi:ribosomal protein S18 acetylase RimI-like enzyme